MVEIKVIVDTPLEALSTLAAFGMYCNADVCAAACRILEAEKHSAGQSASAQAEAAPAGADTGADTPSPVEKPAPDTPQAAPAPTAVPGPADGADGPTPAPGGKPEPVPTAEQVRAKGIEAARKYGNPAVKAVLAELGVTGIGALTEAQRLIFLAGLERLGAESA